MTDWGLCFFDGGTGIAMGHIDEKRSPCLKNNVSLQIQKTYYYGIVSTCYCAVIAWLSALFQGYRADCRSRP
jgi:cyanate permease